MPRNLSQITFWILSIVIAIFQLYYLISLRAVLPYADDWEALDGLFNARERGQLAQWAFTPKGGHFAVPGRLAYWVSFKLFSLNLAPIRLIHFPLGLVAVALTCYVIQSEISRSFPRAYLGLGASFLIFSLGRWEHFAVAGDVSVTLSVLSGATGMYYIIQATDGTSVDYKRLLFGLGFLLAAILSFGVGYLVVTATIAVIVLEAARRRLNWHRSLYQNLTVCVISAFLVLAALAYPAFPFYGTLLRLVGRSILVMGSIGAPQFDYKLARLDAAYCFGIIIFLCAIWSILDFLKRRQHSSKLLPFSIGLVLLGMCGCAAVTLARVDLPDEQFLASRYTLYPSISLLGLLLYCGIGRMYMLAHIWCLAAACYLFATIKEARTAPFRVKAHQSMEVAIRNADNLTDDQLGKVLFARKDMAQVRRVIAILKAERLTIFRDQPRVE